MTTTTKQTTDADRRYYAAANYLCVGHCIQEDGCLRNQRCCSLFPRLVRLWATDARKAALQTSGIPDPLVTRPSIRAALYRPSRLALFGDWLDETLHGDRVLWGIAVAGVAVFVALIVVGR